MCISFASAILHLRIYPTDIDASVPIDLCQTIYFSILSNDTRGEIPNVN